MKLRANARFSTVCLHAGQEPDPTTGAILSPFDSWLVLRGTKTLPLRMAEHSANGQILADGLVRISVGLEDIEDLKEDLDSALALV